MSAAYADPAALRAYVACGYLLGQRGDELLAGLASTSDASAAATLASELGHTDQQRRARALAEALTEVARALHAQRLR